MDYFDIIRILVCSVTRMHEGHQPRSSVFVIIETFRLSSQLEVLNVRTIRVERATELNRCTTLVQIQEPVLHIHNHRLLHGTINCRIFYICISYHLLTNFRQTPDKNLPAKRRSVFPIIYMMHHDQYKINRLRWPRWVHSNTRLFYHVDANTCCHPGQRIR